LDKPLGSRVPNIIKCYKDTTSFYTALQCFTDVRKHLPTILQKRRDIAPEKSLHALDLLQHIVQPLDEQVYDYFRVVAAC